MKKRFSYAHSGIYGWAVYDRERGNIPAYDACSDLLPLRYAADGSATAESPVLMLNELAAMRLCARLNRENDRRVAQ